MLQGRSALEPSALLDVAAAVAGAVASDDDRFSRDVRFAVVERGTEHLWCEARRPDWMTAIVRLELRVSRSRGHTVFAMAVLHPDPASSQHGVHEVTPSVYFYRRFAATVVRALRQADPAMRFIAGGWLTPELFHA